MSIDCAQSAINSNDIKHLQEAHREMQATTRRTFAVVDEIKGHIFDIKRSQDVFISTTKQYMNTSEIRIKDADDKSDENKHKISFINGKLWGLGIIVITILGSMFHLWRMVKSG